MTPNQASQLTVTTIFCSAVLAPCLPNATVGNVEKYTVSAEALMADDGSAFPPTVAAVILWPTR
jgi:hypothetical protein